MRYYQRESLSSGIAIFYPFFSFQPCQTSTPHCLYLLFYPVKPFFFRIFSEVAIGHIYMPLVLRKVVRESIRIPATKFLLLNCICFSILQIFPNNFQIKQPSGSLLFNIIQDGTSGLNNSSKKKNQNKPQIPQDTPPQTTSTFLQIGFIYIRKNAISYKPSWSSFLPTEFYTLTFN